MHGGRKNNSFIIHCYVFKTFPNRRRIKQRVVRGPVQFSRPSTADVAVVVPDRDPVSKNITKEGEKKHPLEAVLLNRGDRDARSCTGRRAKRYYFIKRY